MNHREKEREENILAGEHCPNCDHELSEPINDIWKDPQVKAALKEGRSADDIAVLDCPKCSRWGYYNEGSHFWCRFCSLSFSVLSEDESPTDGVPYVYLDAYTTLADTVPQRTQSPARNL